MLGSQVSLTESWPWKGTVPDAEMPEACSATAARRMPQGLARGGLRTFLFPWNQPCRAPCFRLLGRAQAAVVRRGGSARIAFHAFSMLGWSLYSLLLQDMAAACSSPKLADVCGAVLDSTPDTAVRDARQQCS